MTNISRTLTLRTDILNYLLNPAQRGKCEFVMEVTDKTRADVKVGLLKKYLLMLCMTFIVDARFSTVYRYIYM